MRLILSTRARTVLDVEFLYAPKRTTPPPARPAVEANDGGQFERAAVYGDPQTTVGFGFRV